MQKKDYRFFNLPKGYSLEDYEEAMNLIVKKYSKINGLLSIYNWGNPSVPGISDIDIVFVFKNNIGPLPFLRRSFNLLNSKTRYLARHPFVFIGENDFRNIRYIYPTAKLSLLHGKQIKINKLSSIDEHHSKIAVLNDIIIRHYPRDFIEQLVNKKINARDTLLRLNSLKYTIKTLEDLTREKNRDWAGKLEVIKNLRRNWFEAKDFDLLASLNEDAVLISMEIIEKFRSFLIKNNLLRISLGDNVSYEGIKNKSLFVKNWNKYISLHGMIKNIKSRGKFHSVLPLELSAQLFEYSNFNGLISSHIKKNLKGKLIYKLKYKKIIENRINILNSQAELAFKLRHSDFAAFFDFGYRNKSGINNRILSLSDKFRF